MLIPLHGRSGIAAWAGIDPADAEMVGPYRWYLETNGYARTQPPVTGGRRSLVYMHRLLLSAPPGLQVDHINHDRLDNRRANLRLATCAENAHNTRAHRDNPSGIKGVCWNKRDRKWEVQIMHLGQKFSVGMYAHIDDAAAAYRKAADCMHGQFAYQPQGDET